VTSKTPNALRFYGIVWFFVNRFSKAPHVDGASACNARDVQVVRQKRPTGGRPAWATH
jgi:hypothetical protein